MTTEAENPIVSNFQNTQEVVDLLRSSGDIARILGGARAETPSQ